MHHGRRFLFAHVVLQLGRKFQACKGSNCYVNMHRKVLVRRGDGVEVGHFRVWSVTNAELFR